MSSKKQTGSPKKAEVSPASGPQPKASNAMGRITPKTSPPPSKKAPTNPNAKEYVDELLDWGESLTSPEQVKDQWGQLQQAKTAALEAGDHLGATAAKDGLAVLQDKAKQMGMSGKDLPGVAGPLLDILGALGGIGGRGRGGLKGGKPPPTAAAKTKTEKPAKTAPEQNTSSENGKAEKGGYTPGKGRNANGKCGEWQARRDLEEQGYEVTSVQNKSGHGIDVVGRNPKTGDVRVLEVKTTQTDVAPQLKGAGKEMGGEKFVVDRLSKAANGLGHYKNLPEVKAEAKKVQKWLKEAKQRNAKVDYEKHDVFVEDPDKGCMKRKDANGNEVPSKSTDWVAKPKKPRIKK